MTDLAAGRVSPFGYLRIEACLAAPRSFSQPSTSFIASRRLGIHRTPFVACHVDVSHGFEPRAPPTDGRYKACSMSQSTPPRKAASTCVFRWFSKRHTRGKAHVPVKMPERHCPMKFSKTLLNFGRHEYSRLRLSPAQAALVETSRCHARPAVSPTSERLWTHEMEDIGLEPMTPALQRRCSPN